MFDITKTNIELPDGSGKEIDLPFSSKDVDEHAIYTYIVQIKNSFLFSGKIHVIPDDCVEKILINNQEMSSELFNSSNCDTRNGFFLDISPFLNSGNNTIKLTIRNNQGLYGLVIRDTTFYEKYILFALVIVLVFLVDFKFIYTILLKSIRKGISEYKKLFWILNIQILLLTSIYVVMIYSNDPNFYKGFFFVTFSLLPLGIVAKKLMQTVINPYPVLVILCLGVLIWLAYSFVLPYFKYSYDYSGHLEYIQYMVANGETPVASGGWSFYHPSFYYRFAATIWMILDYGKVFTPAELVKLMQGLSVILFIFYAFFSVKTVDVLFRRTGLNKKSGNLSFSIIHLLTIALIIYWPANAITANRLGNDMMFNLCFAISFYSITKWWYSNSFRYFLIALIFASLDVWAKTNGFIMLGIIGILFMIRLANKNTRYFQRRTIWSMFCMLILVSCMTCYLSLHERIKKVIQDPQSRLIVGNANQLMDELIVENQLQNYLCFNPVSFVRTPFTNSFDNNKGRNFFWFYLLKTSMFGEFDYQSDMLRDIGSFLSCLLLFIIAPSLFGTSAVIGKQATSLLPFLISITMLIASMIIFRLSYPYSPSNDFRYIYPAIVPFVSFAGVGAAYLMQRKFFFIVVICIFILFILCSVWFQLSTFIMLMAQAL